jgi:hypothetical protein
MEHSKGKGTSAQLVILDEFGEQMELFGRPDRIDPTTCEYRVDTEIPNVSRCLRANGTYVGCTRSVCGEPPRCAVEPLDNGADAVARRLEWMREHEG